MDSLLESAGRVQGITPPSGGFGGSATPVESNPGPVESKSGGHFAGLIAFERGDRDSRVRVTEKGRLQFERAVGEFVSRLADQGFVPQRDEIHYFALWANAAGFYIDAFNTQAIIGWTRDEIVGQRVWFMASPDCLTQVRTLTGIYEGMFSQGRNYRIPWTYLAKDGREVRVELHLVPERFGRESVIRIEAHIPFVTELLKSV